MKKILPIIVFISLIDRIFAQSWAMHEVYDDASENEPLTSMHIMFGILFLLILYGLYRVFISKTIVSKKRYKTTRNISLIFYLILALAIPSISEVVLGNKYREMFEETKEFILHYSTEGDYLTNCDFFDYSVYQLSSQVTANEVQDFLFFEFRDVDNDYWIDNYFNIEKVPVFRYDNHPYSDTVYSTYVITRAPKINLWNVVSSEGKHANKRLITPILNNFSTNIPNIYDTAVPYMIQFSIRPSRIRYFEKEGEVQYDVVESFESFIASEYPFVKNHIPDRDNRDYLIRAITEYNDKNSFFNIRWTDNGIIESIKNKKLRGTYSGYNKKEHIYDFFYDVVNYGEHEIIYSISDVKFWTIHAKWSTKKFLFWEISRDNWFDCQFMYTIYKFYLILFVLFAFNVLYLIKLKNRSTIQ